MSKVINFIRRKLKMIMIVISIILVVNVILMIYLLYLYRKPEEYTQRPETTIAENEFSFGNGEEILDVSTNTTESNTKELKASKVSSAIEDFATGFIPYINVNVLQNKDVTPEEFFEENKNYIFQHAGISKKDDFITLCNALENVDCNLDSLCNAYYIENTAEYRNNILKVEIRLTDESGKTMNVKVRTSEKSENRYRYEIIK